MPSGGSSPATRFALFGRGPAWGDANGARPGCEQTRAMGLTSWVPCPVGAVDQAGSPRMRGSRRRSKVLPPPTLKPSTSGGL